MMITDTKSLGDLRFWRRFQVCLLLILAIALSTSLTSCGESEGTRKPQATQSGLTSPGAPSDPSDPGATAASEATSDDPDLIQAKWESSSHADTFVVTEGGVNSKCARCHAPFNFIPTMDDMPESCATCKFEVDPPPPLTSEADWIDIECKVCHKFKHNKIEPGFAWLEIAPIEEYAEVSSSTELCDKCHLAEEVEGHFSVVVMGDHPGFLCTDCHDAHDTKATCSTSGCHEGILEADLPGHDDDHMAVSCMACHDSGVMEIGILEDTGTWFTFTPDAGGGLIPAASHNILLEAPCERCHFEENPWGLGGSVGDEAE